MILQPVFAYMPSRQTSRLTLRLVVVHLVSKRANSAWKAVAIQKVRDAAAPSVLLADDQEEVRQTIAHLLELEFRIVGMAENGERALELTPNLSPDVVVLDICMPVLNGIEAAEQLRESGCPAKVIFLTAHADQDFVEAAFSAGAFGYVLKSSAGGDLIPAIHQALEGKHFVSSPLWLK